MYLCTQTDTIANNSVRREFLLLKAGFHIW